MRALLVALLLLTSVTVGLTCRNIAAPQFIAVTFRLAADTLVPAPISATIDGRLVAVVTPGEIGACQHATLAAGPHTVVYRVAQFSDSAVIVWDAKRWPNVWSSAQAIGDTVWIVLTRVDGPCSGTTG